MCYAISAGLVVDWGTFSARLVHDYLQSKRTRKMNDILVVDFFDDHLAISRRSKMLRSYRIQEKYPIKPKINERLKRAQRAHERLSKGSND